MLKFLKLCFTIGLCFLAGQAWAASVLTVTQLSPLVLPAALQSRANASAFFVTTGAGTNIGAGRLQATDTIPSTTTGTYQSTTTSVTLTGPGGSTLTLGNFVYGLTGTSTPGTFTLTGTGDVSVNGLTVGGNLTVKKNSLAGIYTGIINMQVTDSIGGSVIAPLSVNFVLLNANTIKTQADMVFPPQLVGTSPAASTIAPNDSGAAVFSAAGTPGATATVVVTGSVSLTKAGTGNTITVSSFTYGGSALNTGSITFPTSVNPGVVNNIRVGANAFFPANSPPGVYTGSGTLTMNY